MDYERNQKEELMGKIKTSLDGIEAKIDEFVSKSRALTGKSIRERESWNTQVTGQAIRHFAYGISDDNPLWLDADYAAQSPYGRLVAPPTFLTSVLYPALHGAPMEIPMSNLIGELAYQWFHPILEGDILRGTAQQIGVYESQDREGRRLVCILAETSYWNQKNELVGKANGNLVWMAREENLLIDRPIYNYTEEELAKITTAIEEEKRTGNEELCGEDIEVGQEIPQLVRGPMTVGDLICWQAAIGPSYRPGALGYKDGLKAPHSVVKNPVTGWSVKNSQHHEDFLLAKQRGMPAPFDNGVMRFAWLSPLLTNWMGTRGELKKLSVQMVAPVLYGDTVWYKGTVIKTIETDQGTAVKIKITGTNQLGEITTTGEAEVMLPSVSSSKKERERLELLIRQQEPKPVYPEAPCIHELFANLAEKTPDAIALRCNDQHLTYGDLNRRANQLAHYLGSQGFKTDTLVGICLDRSFDFVISILAILKAGGAYLPLDADYPQERLAFMLKDAGVSLMLSQTSLSEQLPAGETNVINLDDSWQVISKESEENPENAISSNSYAYAVYTSGSTGKPKAVPVNHYSLYSYISSIKEPLGIVAKDIYLHTASFSFSAGVRQTLLPLSLGATLVIANSEQRRNPQALFTLIQEQKVTVWDTVPTFWRFCIEELAALTEEQQADCLHNQLRLILVTGEPLAWEIPYRWRYQLKHPADLINLYSQSETTGTVSYYLIPEQFEQQEGIVPLGKVIEDSQILLLDEELQEVATGTVGQLCVTGQRLVSGYLNRPQLTAEKFILNPFDQEQGMYLYKTGDLARYLPDGNLEFVGRADRRVKIRGFRIELEEVEGMLANHPQIRQAAVVVRETNSGDKRLIAYAVPHLETFTSTTLGERSPRVAEGRRTEQQDLNSNSLRRFLQEKLPEYAVPSAFVLLEALPLNPNGKVDRRSLPVPDLSRLHLTSTFVAPQDELELELAKIWENLLDIKPIGIEDDFFELGGHSLLAVRLFAQIEKIFGQNLPLALLFDAPTVGQLAQMLRQEGWSASWSSLVAIQPSGSKPPLFCIHGIGGNIFSYKNLARYLGKEQPVYGLQAQGWTPQLHSRSIPSGSNGEAEAIDNMEEMAARYLEEIRTVQPEGPYFLAGHSYGGTVAFEMAQQLHAQGETVAMLAMFDSSPPEVDKMQLSTEEENQRKEAFLEQLPDWSQEPNIFPLIEVLYAAKLNYEPRVYAGKVTYFQVKETASSKLTSWSKLTEVGLDSYEVDGDHWTMLEEPHIQLLAEKLKTCLENV